MKIGIDIGGVISKYPKVFKSLIKTFQEKYGTENIYIITDQHPKEYVLASLRMNGIGFDGMEERFQLVRCADYDKYCNMCKAILIKELELDIYIDDFDGYLQWDSTLGPQPLLLKVMPDAYKPYWHETWNTEGESSFGRKVCLKTSV